MVILFEDDFAPTDEDVLATPDTGDYKITTIPWEDFGTGPLKVTITLEAKKVSGEPLLNAFVAPSNYYDDALDYDGLVGANVTTGSFVEYTLELLGVPYIEFDGPGAARTLFIASGHVYPPGSGGDFKVKNIHVKVEGDPSFGVEIVEPEAGATVGPDDALVFRVFNDGLPDTLTADVTLADGTVERAWEYDQAVNGYTGSLEIDGNRRTYTIRRPIGWPFGGLSLSVAVGNEGGGVSVTTLGPYMETDESSGASGAEVVKTIPIDFDALPAGTLTPTFTDGEVRYDTGNFGDALVILGGTGPFYGDGVELWQAGAGPDPGGPIYKDIVAMMSANPMAPFTNPGGTVNLRLFGNSGISGLPSGFKDFTITLSGASGPESASASRSWTVDGDVDAASRTIIQYREAPKLNKLIRLHQHIFAQLTEVARQINELDDPAEATGVNLDVTADIVGQPRLRASGDVPSDAELRVLIAARISRNNARVATADYLEALVTLFAAKVRISVDGGMSLAYVVMREPTPDEIAVLDEDIVARPMGVKVLRSWAPTDYFGYLGDPDAKGYGVGHYVKGF